MTTTGPSGEKRPNDPMAMSIHVAKIATGEIEETLPERETELGRIAAEEALTLEEKPKPTTPPSPEPTRTVPPPSGPPREVEKSIDPARTTTG